MDDKELKGYVFNIQRYSIHDGPGIRTTVFLKGCPLRCYWCQNPESHRQQLEIYFDKNLCTMCGRCVAVCPTGASTLSDASSIIDRGKCIVCGKCVEACPNEARRIVGRCASAEEIFKEVKKDLAFFRKSGGGVTLSGGEPLAQPEFAIELLKLCHQSGIHTALDTSGYAKWPTVKEVLNYCDLVLYDLKDMDLTNHKKNTGVSNRLILDNAKRIAAEWPMWVRFTVVPGYCNDSVEKIEATAKFISVELGNSVKVCVLAYHRLGEPKYERLGKLDRLISDVQPPTDETMAKYKEVCESYGLETQIGG